MVFSIVNAFFVVFLKKGLQFICECVYCRLGNALSHGVAMIFLGLAVSRRGQFKPPTVAQPVRYGGPRDMLCKLDTLIKGSNRSRWKL